MAKVNKDLLEDILRHISVILFKLDELDMKIESIKKSDDMGLAREIMHNAEIKQEHFLRNYERLNEMIKEFKGLVSIVRGETKSNWYKKEFEVVCPNIDFSSCKETPKELEFK